MRTIGFRGLLVLLLFIAPLQNILAQDDPVRIEHIPVNQADVGQPVKIEARLIGVTDESQVQEAKLWFKGHDEDAFDFINMPFELGQFIGSIPRESVNSQGVDYFIEVLLNDGSSFTFPESNPLSDPQLINVRSAEARAATEAVLLISPEPFSRIRGEVLIAVAFNRYIRELDTSKIRLRLNGADKTSRAQITDEILIATFPKLTPGRQRIDLLYDGDEGTEQLGSWGFFYVSEEQAGKDFSEYVGGTSTSEGIFQRYNGYDQRIFREKFNIKFESGPISLVTKGRLTSEEEGYRQPKHQFQVDLGLTKHFHMRYGDINPRYNEIILWGRRVRGAELDVDVGFTRLQMIYGDMTRDIEGLQYVDTLIDTTTSTTYQDTTYKYGTYRRWTAATRLSFGAPNRFMVGITAMKAKDDTSSILYGNNPKDNLVAGADLNVFFDRKRVALTAQTALSLYNENTLEAPLEDAEDFKDIIWINQYFDPLPSEGITTDTLTDETSLDMDKVVSSIIKNALSYKGKLRLRYFGNDLQIGYKSINKSYNTLGNPTLISDKAGYFVKDRLRLFKSRVYFNIGYESYWDNVNDRGDIRSTQDLISTGLSIYTADHLPDITFGFKDILNANDGTQSIYAPDPLNNPDILDTIDTRKENQTQNISFSLSQRVAFANTDNQIAVSYSMSDRSDTYFDLGDAKNNGYYVSVRSEYDMPFNTTFNYSNSSLTSIGGLTDVSYNFINLRFNYFFLNKKLIPYFAPRITLASGSNSITQDDPAVLYDGFYTPEEIEDLRRSTYRTLHLDYRKIDWSFGFVWRVHSRHTLEGGVSITSYTENGEYEYWNGNRFSVSETSITNDGLQLDQPEPIDRDDIVASITYRMRF